MKNTFYIFKNSNKVLYPTIGNILFITLIIVLNVNLGFDQQNIFLRYLSAFLILCFIAFIFTKSFRYKYIEGKLEGTISFNEISLEINNTPFQIIEIKNIFLRIDDFKGKTKSYKTTIPMSNGTNNLLDLELINGKKIKLFFQIENEFQVEEIKPFIISLIRNKISTIDSALNWLQIDDEFEKIKFETTETFVVRL